MQMIELSEQQKALSKTKLELDRAKIQLYTLIVSRLALSALERLRKTEAFADIETNQDPKRLIDRIGQCGCLPIPRAKWSESTTHASLWRTADNVPMSQLSRSRSDLRRC